MDPIKLVWKTGKPSKTIRISFSDSSITDVDADAVITVLTRKGDKPGGLSESIIKKAGNTVMGEIGNEKERELTENIVTKAGNLKCKFIIHCVCPKWADYDDGSKSECLKELCNTVKMALKAACDKRLNSVAMPPIGSGFEYGIPNFASSAMYVKAIKEFVDFLPGLAHPLKEIIFCDKSKEMTRLVRNAFEMSKNSLGILSETSVMMQSMNISKPFNHSLHGDSASKKSPSGVTPGVQSYKNPYTHHPLPPAPQQLSSSASSNTFVPNSNIPSYWVYQGGKDGTDTFMVNNLRILIYTYDIVNLCNVDIIVSTENTQVAGNGKLAKAILQKAGKGYQKEHAKLFSSNNKRNWTDVLQTRAGQLNCKVVLHAIIERFPNVDPSRYHLDMMQDTIRKVLEIANEKKNANIFRKFQCLSLALPLLGTGSVTNRNFREKYATAMMQGIEAFSSRSKLKLQEVHIVSVDSNTTQILLDICQSFCYVPFSGKEERKKPSKEETKKGQRKESVKFNPLEFNLLETWRAIKQNKQATVDSFYEPVTAVAPVPVQEENSASEGGNLLLIDWESDDESSQQHLVTTEQMNGACAAIRNGSTCVICLDDDLTEPVRLKICKHEFCRECISEFLSQKPACPVCNTVYGEMFGNQPVDGKATIYHDESALPGFKCGTLIIHYEFPNGRQAEEHPSPGKFYRGISRQCYLPDSAEGREILQLLKRAFERRLIFTVGSSRTSGRDNVVTWNDIHHKTRRAGGPEQYGYPDPGYLARVRDELSAKGISND